jgi:hypothetical protein
MKHLALLLATAFLSLSAFAQGTGTYIVTFDFGDRVITNADIRVSLDPCKPCGEPLPGFRIGRSWRAELPVGAYEATIDVPKFRT